MNNNNIYHKLIIQQLKIKIEIVLNKEKKIQV